MIISVDQIDRTGTADLDDLTETLLRASECHELTVWLLPSGCSSRPPLGWGTTADLDALGDVCARSTVRRLIGAHQRTADAVLHLGSDTITFVAKGSAQEALLGFATDVPADVGRLLVTDRTGHTEALRKLSPTGLGVADRRGRSGGML